MMTVLPSLLLVSTFAPVTFSGVQPQLAAAGQRVGLVFGRGGTIQFALSRDAGRSFSTPVAVPSRGRLALGRHRGPRIALTDTAIVITAILGDGPEDGDLFAWRSVDDGRTWSDPRRLNRVPASAREGLHATAAGGGTVVAAWLDLRAHGTQVYAAVSRDAGVTWSGDQMVYQSPSGSVCECCHPSVAVSAGGEIAVMFRNRLAGARDLYLVRSEDSGRSFGSALKLGQGTWPLEACPMDGGAMAFGSDGRLTTVWRRGNDVLFAEAGGTEQRLGTGRDPALAVAADGTRYAVWRSDEGLVLVDSRKPETRPLAKGAQTPVLLALADGRVLAAWERAGQVAVSAVSGAA